jgi:hypothetical protein
MTRFVVPRQGTEIYFGPQPRASLRFALGCILAAFQAAQILRCALEKVAVQKMNCAHGFAVYSSILSPASVNSQSKIAGSP